MLFSDSQHSLRPLERNQKSIFKFRFGGDGREGGGRGAHAAQHQRDGKKRRRQTSSPNTYLGFLRRGSKMKMESYASSASSKSLSGTFPEPVLARRDSRAPSAPRICQVTLKSRQPWSSSKHAPVRYFRAPAWQRKDASKDEAAVPPSPPLHHSSVLPAQPVSVSLLLPHSLIECLSKNGSPTSSTA